MVGVCKIGEENIITVGEDKRKVMGEIIENTDSFFRIHTDDRAFDKEIYDYIKIE